MKSLKKLSIFAIGLIAVLGMSSCSDPMDEITSLVLDRNFAPVAFSAKVINKTNIKLEWNKSDADSYTVEVYANDENMEFTGTPVRVITGITAGSGSTVTYTVEGLEGETFYSVRVKAVTEGDEDRDSKWSTAVVQTDAEQILFDVDEENDITATSITIRWPAGQNATSVFVTPGDVEYPVTADEVAAGAKTISGLTPEQTYTFVLKNGEKTRGTIKAKTAIDLGGAIVVKPGDDLKAKLDAAEDGDAFAFMPGTYTMLNDEGKIGTYTLTKNVSFKSVRSYDRAVIQAAFVLKDADIEMTQIVLDGNKDAGIAFDYTGSTAGQTRTLKIEDCEIKGYTKDFIFDGKVNLAIDITINNCIVHDMPLSQRFVDIQGGVFKTLKITNSTFYKVSGGDSFIRADAKSVNGVSPAAIIDHCTLDGMNTSGKGVLYIRNGASIVFTNNNVTNSKGLFANFTPFQTPTFENNNYYASPNFVESTKEEGVTAKYYDNAGSAYDPQYAGYDSGDLTVGSDDLKANKCGDPRWIK